jgi:hypothetical protein
MRRAQVRSSSVLRRAAAEDRDGGLNQEPAGARVAGLGDRAAPLRLARAVLAGHEAEVGFELMRVVEALGIIDGGEEGGGGDGADAGDGAQARHAGILDGEFLALDPSYHGKGLERGGRLEQTVWNEFSADRERLARLTAAIRLGHQTPLATVSGLTEELWRRLLGARGASRVRV